MFTGLVEACVRAASLERRGRGARLCLPAPGAGWTVGPGESVAVSGCCLTVAGLSAEGQLAFDLSAETLERSWFGSALRPGVALNLERALRLGDRLGGHLVSGHVDAVGRIASIEDADDGGALVGFEVPAGFEAYLVDKGSVCVDGISLTVVGPAGRTFRAALIPETLARTSLGAAAVGQPVNLEADLVGKWVERFVQLRTR
jgi:riboflavin synthase